RAIHGDVGVAENVLRARVAARAQRDSDTGSRKRRVFVEHKRLRQFILNSFSDAHSVSRIRHSTQQDRELIATKTRERIDRTQCSFQPLSKSDEQQIAVRVAQAVVDVLETIEIEE